MATKKQPETAPIERMVRDPQRSAEVFQQAKRQYLSSDITPETLQEIIPLFELAASLDVANKDAVAYLNFAQRDLNGLQKKKKGVVGGHTRARTRSAPKDKDDAAILVAYETEDEANSEEDVELYGEDDEAEPPPWDPVKGAPGEEEAHPWEES